MMTSVPTALRNAGHVVNPDEPIGLEEMGWLADRASRQAVRDDDDEMLDVAYALSAWVAAHK